VGNFRTFVWEDLLRRFLELRGFKVHHVMNITDVDDKIIAATLEQGKGVEQVTAPFTAAFFADLDRLGIKRAHVYPKATEHVPEMVALIRRLLENGLAYSRDGSIYYRVTGFSEYGRLSGKDLQGLEAGASGRVEADEYESKDDVRDFALWKAQRPGEPAWEGPEGPGRPGWHIECSAMSMKYLGEAFDIHTGGVDNIFPHHENEIAQSQGATGLPLARYWLHAAHLIVDGEKMSKSRGNFLTLRNLLDKGYEPRELRYMLLSIHYRRVLDLTDESFAGARQNLRRLDDFSERLAQAELSATSPAETAEAVTTAGKRFHDSLDDDLNTSGALGALFELVRVANGAMDRGGLGVAEGATCREILTAFQEVFGTELGGGEEELPASLAALVSQREKARADRQWAEADRLRDELEAAGILVEDTPQGSRWKKISRE
jgi:cysteinyl-tRNA synthetase